MSNKHDPAAIAVFCRAYQITMRLYPAGYRHTYGHLMAQLFRDQCRDVMSQKGPLGLFRLWGFTLRETLATALAEHFDEFRRNYMIQRNSIIVIGLAIVLAALVGWLNINASEMQPILGTLLFATFLLGALQPKNAWRWALLVCMGVVVSGLLAYFLGITSSGYLHARQINPALPEKESFKAVLQGTISFVPALIGTYSGVLFRKIVETLFVQSPTPQS